MAICEWISLLGCWGTNGMGLTKVEVACEKLWHIRMVGDWDEM